MKTMTRYNKKFFAVSKIYDTAVMTDNEIESSIQKDLDTLTGNAGLVRFQLEIREKEIILRFIRCIIQIQKKKSWMPMPIYSVE